MAIPKISPWSSCSYQLISNCSKKPVFLQVTLNSFLFYGQKKPLFYQYILRPDLHLRLFGFTFVQASRPYPKSTHLVEIRCSCLIPPIILCLSGNRTKTLCRKRCLLNLQRGGNYRNHKKQANGRTDYILHPQSGFPTITISFYHEYDMHFPGHDIDWIWVNGTSQPICFFIHHRHLPGRCHG